MWERAYAVTKTIRCVEGAAGTRGADETITEGLFVTLPVNCILRIAEKKKITRLFFLAVVSCIMKCKQNTVLVNKHSG